MNNQYVLIHHGIKGQKWGVRRFQNPDGTRTEAGKKRSKYVNPVEEDRKNAIKKDNLYSMSDEELTQRIGRLQQEKKLKDLTEENLHPGRRAVTDTIKNVGTKALISAAIGALVFGGKIAVEKLLIRKPDTSNLTEEEAKEKIESYKNALDMARMASNYMFPNPNKK